MKLGDVLRKERTRRDMSAEDMASLLRLSAETYAQFEDGDSQLEEWAPRLARIAISLGVPVSRLISETGKSAQAGQHDGQCGGLIHSQRERLSRSREELAGELGMPVESIAELERGESPLEAYAPTLLKFAEIVEQPLFNLFYPSGLPLGD